MQSKKVRRWSEVKPNQAGVMLITNTETLPRPKKVRQKAHQALHVSAPESPSPSTFSSSPIATPSSNPSTPSPRPTPSPEVAAKADRSKFRVKLTNPPAKGKNSTAPIGAPVHEKWEYNIKEEPTTDAEVEAQISFLLAGISDSSRAEEQTDKNALVILVSEEGTRR